MTRCYGGYDHMTSRSCRGLRSFDLCFLRSKDRSLRQLLLDRISLDVAALAHQAIHRRHSRIAFHLRLVFDLVTEPVQRAFGRLRVAGEHRWAEDVGAEQAAEGGETVDVGAFVAVGGVAAKGEQGGADVMAGGDRRV